MYGHFCGANMHKTRFLVAVVIAVSICPAMARADGSPTTQSNQNPFQLNIGADFPTNHNAQQLVHTAYKIEAVYDLDGGNGAKVPVSLYSGYGWGSHSPVSGARVSYHNYWLGVQARTSSQTYGGLGVGYYGQSGTLNVSGLGSANANHGGVGGTVFVGTDFNARPSQTRGNPGFGIRLGYNFLPNFEGINTDGADVTVTYRF